MPQDRAPTLYSITRENDGNLDHSATESRGCASFSNAGIIRLVGLDASDREADSLAGAVKRTSRRCSAGFVEDIPLLGDEAAIELEIEYDRAGNCRSLEARLSDGGLSYRLANSYGEDGIRVEQVADTGNGRPEILKKRAFRRTGSRIILVATEGAVGGMGSPTAFDARRDRIVNSIFVSTYTGSGKRKDHMSIAYFEDRDRMIKREEINYNDDGSLHESSVYLYDERGDWVRRIRQGLEDDFRGETRRFFDGEGNAVRMEAKDPGGDFYLEEAHAYATGNELRDSVLYRQPGKWAWPDADGSYRTAIVPEGVPRETTVVGHGDPYVIRKTRWFSPVGESCGYSRSVERRDSRGNLVEYERSDEDGNADSKYSATFEYWD